MNDTPQDQLDEGEAVLFCDVCLEPIDDGVFSITSPTEQTVCEHCIDSLANILAQVRAKVEEHGLEKCIEDADVERQREFH